jgi:hypothetical protein
MDNLTFVLVVGLIGLAIVNAASLLWAGYLDRKLRGKPTPKHYDVHVEGTKVFPEVDRQAVEAKAEALLVQAVDKAAGKLQVSLDKSAETIANQLETSTTRELEKYHANLEQLNSKSVAVFDALQAEVAQRRAELFKQLDEEMKLEREKRVELFNAKFNDIVTSYITESLGSQVDLGAEAPYVFEVLNTHKDDIKRDILS